MGSWKASTLSKSAKKSLSLFKTLKKYTKKSDFQWTAEGETTFKQMKKIDSEIAYVNRTKRERRINHLPGGCKRSHQCSPNNINGWETNAHLPLQQCITRPEINYTPIEKLILALENFVLREIHEGSCSMHAGPRSVVAKALKSGYYWPTKHVDARKLIRRCNSCQALEINLDLLEERREQTAIQETKNKAKMEKYYNSRVRNTSLKPGDLIYQNNEASHEEDEGKLRPKWEGPSEVIEALEKGANKLKDRNGNVLP
nr:reverse transcriptase domain-containing protein [Tanacetum cinerariifolium]